MKECSIHPFNVVGPNGCPRCWVETHPLKPRGRMPRRSRLDGLDELEQNDRRDELEPHEAEKLASGI